MLYDFGLGVMTSILIRRVAYTRTVITHATLVYMRAVRDYYYVVVPHNIARDVLHTHRTLYSNRRLKTALITSQSEDCVFNRTLSLKGSGYPESYWQFQHSSARAPHGARSLMWNRAPPGGPLPKI